MSDEAVQWLRKAREDLMVARHEMALPDEETVTAAVCFHCQQFVEKVFKAFLVLHGVVFPRTHNIEYLKELCAQVDPEFALVDVQNLSFYAVEIRYPGGYPTPTLTEAAACLATAESVLQFVERKLSISFESL